MSTIPSSPDHSHPIQPDQEWANALSHGLSAVLWVFVGWWLVESSLQPASLQTASLQTDGPEPFVSAAPMLLYAGTVVLTFTCSTLSHVFLNPPWLDRFRAADQATIYLMIVGTYTPIVAAYAVDLVRWPLMVAMWVAALSGFAAKLILNHRIDSISTVTYLLLGWLPAIPLVGQVPSGLAWMMVAGGVTYSAGVWFLLNDRRRRYLHVVWHLMVLAASLIHAAAVAWYRVPN